MCLLYFAHHAHAHVHAHTHTQHTQAYIFHENKSFVSITGASPTTKTVCKEQERVQSRDDFNHTDSDLLQSSICNGNITWKGSLGRDL